MRNTRKGLVPGGELAMHWLALSLEVSTHLPRAESLEEEEERKAPDHRGADDAEQGDELDSLSTAELGEARQSARPPPTFVSDLGPSQIYRAQPQNPTKSHAGSLMSLPTIHPKLGGHIPRSLSQQSQQCGHFLALYNMEAIERTSPQRSGLSQVLWTQGGAWLGGRALA